MLALATALLCAGAGSALFASPAAAGDINFDNGLLTAAVYNLTPYTWTLVAENAPGPNSYPFPCGYGPSAGAPANCWRQAPGNMAPGGASLFQIHENGGGYACFFGGQAEAFDGYFTYRVDVLAGSPEYVTVAISGLAENGSCGSAAAQIYVYDTTAPPPPGYDAAASQGTPPAAQTPNPQVTYSHNSPYLYDQSFQIVGNYTVDASTNLGAPFVDVLNALCSGGTNTSCAFTSTGPLTWGIGAPVRQGGLIANCTVPARTRSAGSTRRGVSAEPPPSPPDNDPNWHRISVKVARTASVSVGGSLTASAEFNLFGVIGAEVSATFGAEHEWSDRKEFEKTTKVFLPDNYIAGVWAAPVQGKVIGTLVVSSGSASFTITNFQQLRSGVSRDLKTPAFNVITTERPMTAAEYQAQCINKRSRPPHRTVTRRRPLSHARGRGL